MERNSAWISEMKALDDRDEYVKKVMFNCKYPIETMFHTDFTAYEVVPSMNKLNELRQKGYSIYIDNQAPLEDELRELPFIKYIAITGSY